MNSRIALLAFAVICTGSATAGDTGARKYALLSLIGDSLTIVTYRPTTGSRQNHNVEETVPVTDGSFDRVALLAADEALRKADPNASVVLLSSSSPALRAEQRQLLDGRNFVCRVELCESLGKENVTHLLLVTKNRADAYLKLDTGNVGSGKLEGLGYYIDYQYKIRRSDTGEIGVGFLAPYAYYNITLIDLGTSSVLKQHVVSSSRTISAARSEKGADPWNVLTSAQKVNALRGMIRNEMLDALPALVKP